MPAWVLIVIGTAAALSAMAVIWRAVKVVARVINTWDRLGPVMLQMSEQFKSDSGSTLKDQINRLEVAIAELTDAADAAKARRDAGKGNNG